MITKIAIVVVAVIVIVALYVVIRNQQTQKRLEEEERQRRIAEEERKRQLKLEEEARKAARKAEIEAGKEMYHYLNQSIKTMFYHYRTEKWDQLSGLGAVELKDHDAAVRCVNKLPENHKKLVQSFFGCLDFNEKYEGEGNVKDSEGLKAVFEQMMLPFFPVYYREFSSGPRYISFMNQNILKVFSLLSGKKFRLGYKNRYQNGQLAFEWTDQIYRVYRADGKKLCEATFENGCVKDGYAILKDVEASDEKWDIYQKGLWKDGVLQKEDLQYRYNVAVD